MTIARLARLSAGSALVLTEAKIKEEGDLRIHIKGRREGLIEWIRANLGLSDTTTLDVYENKIVYHSSFLSGSFDESIPLHSVSNVGVGILKPFKYLLLSIVSIGVSIYLACDWYCKSYCWIPLIFAVVFGFLYWSRKSILLYITPHCGASTAISFKRSLIEAVSINQETANKFASIILQLIDKQTLK